MPYKPVKPVIAVTMGDPCGIGPEIIAAALANSPVHCACLPVVLGDMNTMLRAVKILGSAQKIIEIEEDNFPADSSPDSIYLYRLTDLDQADMQFGRPTVSSGSAVYRYICKAVTLCQSGKTAAMATAPINKESLNHAGYHYPGHTELLAELTGSEDFVMMLAGDRLKVSLVTIHERLRDVPGLLNIDRILSTIRITARDTGRYFTANPRIAVLALNPHCGEGGLFGDEERSLIRPAVERAISEGINAVGPLSADTLFHMAANGEYDAVVCMYHDQGLIPLKLLHFDDGVNITLGLPIIRTSVDHGTAYDLAGTGRASAESMTAAILTAARMASVKLAADRALR